MNRLEMPDQSFCERLADIVAHDLIDCDFFTIMDEQKVRGGRFQSPSLGVLNSPNILELRRMAALRTATRDSNNVRMKERCCSK